MPGFVFKEAPDVDYYIVWSTVVDAPTFRGNRTAMLEYLQQSSDPYLRDDAPHRPERRLERADETGTSSLWVENAGMRDTYPEDGAWDDDSHIYKQRGTVTRKNLFALCHRLDEDPNADVTDLLEPLEGEDKVRDE